MNNKNSPNLYLLDSGASVITERNDSFRSCSVGIWIASGPRFEDPENSGVSHFIEHMLFKGTEKRTALMIAEEMDEIGGNMNAFTTKEYTCFYARCLTEHALTAFDILADMVTSPKLAPEDIELEKGVIKEEIAMYEDQPDELCYDTLYSRVWRKDMLGANTCGTRETVDAVTREKLVEHLKRFYVPGRTVISVGGCFDEEKIIEKCRDYFDRVTACFNPMTFSTPEYCRSFTAVKKDFEQNQVVIAFPGVPLGSEKLPAVRLISTILASATSSKLFQRLREELGLVYNVDSDNAFFLNAGLFMVSIAVSEKSEKRALEEALAIIRDFSSSVTEKELARAKEQTVAGIIMGLESSISRASHFGREFLLEHKTTSIDENVSAMRAVTLDELKRTADEIFRFENASVCAVGRVHSERWYKELIKKFSVGAKNE